MMQLIMTTQKKNPNSKEEKLDTLADMFADLVIEQIDSENEQKLK